MDVLLSPELLIATLALAAIYALIALGLNLIYGAMRLLNVAHGEIMMLGAYLTFGLFSFWQVSPLLAAPVAMLVAAALGGVLYELLIRRLSQHALAQRIEANSLLVFFGLSVILQNLGALLFSANARSLNYMETLVQIGSVSIALNRLVIIAASSIATLAVMVFLRLGTTGLAIRALIQQREAASLVGVQADRVNRVIFCLGFALAAAAAQAGAQVTLVAGPVHLPTPAGVQRIDVKSAREMLTACEAAMPADVLIAAAAVADYHPQTVAAHKLKKNPQNPDGLRLQLRCNPDILATLAKRKDRPFCVGFAAETEHLLEHAAVKLHGKNLDLIVANDVKRSDIGFNSDDNAVTVIDRSGQQIRLDKASKSEIARQLIDLIASHLPSPPAPLP